MKKCLQSFKEFLREAEDPTYHQETFYFTILIAMSKERGGSRDETKNDIRAFPEILTVTLVEPEKGGVQRDVGTKYLSTLKIHCRHPKNTNKRHLMKRAVLLISNLRGVTVLRYKETKPRTRRKQFHGQYKINELDYQKVRRQKSKQYTRMKKRLLSKGPQKPGAPFVKKADPKRAKSGPPGFGAMGEDLLVKIGSSSNSDLLAFDVHRELQQKIWEGDKKIRSGVRAALMDIVDEFLENLDLDIAVKDIILTGSMANYNWSKFSDIDLHVLVDFADVNDDETLVKRFFDAVRSNWNKLHNITVKGHEVEVYIQHESEPHVSTGVYSLIQNRWLVKPQKVKPFIDEATALKKMGALSREIDKLRSLYEAGQYEDTYNLGARIKEKVKRMRLSGLEKEGIYSPENVAFKLLRRSGDIEKLFSLYVQAYDKIYSLDQ